MNRFYVARPDGTVIGKFTDAEFRAKASQGEIWADCRYLAEGTKEWRKASEYPDVTFPRKLSTPRKTGPKKQHSPLEIGVYCALIAAFAPLLHGTLFFFISAPLLIAAFVLAIISIVRGRIAGGILLLMGVFFAFPVSCVAMTDREKILRHEPIR